MYLGDGMPLQAVFRELYGDFLLSFFVLMFPVLYQLVFGHLPLEGLRRKRFANLYLHKLDLPPFIGSTTSPATSPTSRIEEPSATQFQVAELGKKEGGKTEAAEDVLVSLGRSSKELADGIYGRSGVYLLVGVMVAFSGLAFFYSQTTGTFNTSDLTASLVSLAPKFGILFFIEFVAFFFLKQYRTAMDEFRYYEAIKRHREETLVLIKIGNEQTKPVDVFELVKLGQFFSSAGRLQKEETTELLETRKLEKNETAVLEKVIDAIAQARK